MTEINPQLVKDLREKTGAGMLDCKKALTEAKGDLNLAIEVLRKSGIAKAEKKSTRTAKEGTISSMVTDNAGTIVELLCETDFVAKNETFKNYAREVTEKVAALNESGDVSVKINEQEKSTLISMIATIGENLQIRRAVRWAGKCASYLHGGGRIGVMIEFEGAGETAALNDICMHIAAFSPRYVSSAEIPAQIIEKEKEIQGAQLAGKPANMVEKILQGKLAKWYTEVCLNNQPWIRDDKVSVEKANQGIKVKRFVRWQVGEEI